MKESGRLKCHCLRKYEKSAQSSRTFTATGNHDYGPPLAERRGSGTAVESAPRNVRLGLRFLTAVPHTEKKGDSK